ncbi:MAG: hypothetical protein PHV85_00200 [Desulfovibrionaceae bacterium]|nr:hypothetical protein [Desulfovibrionaceae bacterium]MDD8013454.1 hypothetical protein [Acidobacteriota bacterium]
MKRRDLERLSLADVLGLMVSGSGKSWEEVASEVGWSPFNVNRIRNPRDNYWPSLPMLAPFCVACGSTLVLDWVRAQARTGGVAMEFEALDCRELLLNLAGLFKEMGDVAAEGKAAVEGDKIIQAGEARRIIRELYDVINHASDMVSGLRRIAGEPE